MWQKKYIKTYCFLLIPSRCKTRSSLIQNIYWFSRWKSLHRQFWSMTRIFILLKSSRLWSDSPKCGFTGRNVFFVRSLLCPFIRLWKGCLDLPTYWRPQIYIYIYIYIYVWKLNQTVLELDFIAVKFLFFPRRDLNPHHCYTAAPFA